MGGSQRSDGSRCRRLSVLVPYCVLALVVASDLPADRLQLANGDIVSGTIVRMGEDVVVIRTQYGMLEIPREAVVRGEFGREEGSTGQADAFSGAPARTDGARPGGDPQSNPETGASGDSAAASGGVAAAGTGTTTDGSTASSADTPGTTTSGAAVTASGDRAATPEAADATPRAGESGPADADSGLLFWFPFDGDLRDIAPTAAGAGLSSPAGGGDGPAGTGAAAPAGAAAGAAAAASESGYRITNNGLAFTQDYAGNGRSALYSNGTGTYLSIPPSDALNDLDAFTILFRVRLDATDGTSYLVSKWDRARGDQAEGTFTLQSSDGALTLFLVAEDGTYNWVGADAVLEPERWHSVAASFADGTATLYVDGSAVRSRAFSFTELASDDAPVLVMTAQANTNDPYGYYNAAGSIDDLRLYDRALSPREIASVGIVTAR